MVVVGCGCCVPYQSGSCEEPLESVLLCDLAESLGRRCAAQALSDLECQPVNNVLVVKSVQCEGAPEVADRV
jgi:hypothetical protein